MEFEAGSAAATEAGGRRKARAYPTSPRGRPESPGCRAITLWGFPEVWVAVPERESPSRPAGRGPGLTIHLLEGGTYGTARESRTFPGWTANEIHMALNEPVRSAVTSRVLDRVGRGLGARDGTGPDDTLWLRAHREEGRARGRAEGQAEGRAEGRVEGRAEARAEFVAAFRRKLPASRGGAGVSDEAIIDALLECEDQSDFWARIERSRR